jgi:hypothetical protein
VVENQVALKTALISNVLHMRLEASQQCGLGYDVIWYGGQSSNSWKKIASNFTGVLKKKAVFSAKNMLVTTYQVTGLMTQTNEWHSDRVCCQTCEWRNSTDGHQPQYQKP